MNVLMKPLTRAGSLKNCWKLSKPMNCTSNNVHRVSEK